ncbi:MAG: amidohydrolase family protein [Bradyrhizobiaceae bacterium]|nr:amidohydrolase family protein [Bradyrhizobiaceae bacterium]
MATQGNHQPRLTAPRGSCDTHMHIYDHRFPLAPTATFDPPDALVPNYLALRQRLGVDRNVVVQPTAYGKDNRCTLQAIAAIGPSARGVAVVDETVSDAELERLTKAGIRGARFHMLAGAPLPWDVLERVAARTREFGWHVQLQLDGRELPEREALIRRVSGTLVIDHVGKFLEPVPTDHPSFRLLLRLVENGRTYVKLSAPYEVSKVGAPYYDDVGALAKMLVRIAAERMLWATNWPHPTPVTASPKPDDALLLDMLLDWIPDEATRHKVLVDNPAQLYGFG